MSQQKKRGLALNQLETLHATGAADPITLEAIGSTWKALSSRVEKANYRLAEAHLLSEGESHDPFQSIRTLISRGFLIEAENELSRLTGVSSGSPETLSQILLEIARIHYQNGEWNSAARTATEAMRIPGLAGLTRLTLLQIRAAAWFECGEFSRASADIETARSLQQLYPAAQSAFYTDVLAIKLLARQDGGHADAEAAAQRLLQNALASGRGNADTLLTVSRLKIDLQRLANLPIASLAQASYALAEAMGDRLYSRLALVDLQYCESSSLREEANILLNRTKSEFRRVERLREDCDSGSLGSESARTILAHAVSDEPVVRSLNTQVLSIVFLESNLQITLPDLTATKLKLQQRTVEILLTVQSSGEISKEELFQRLWNLRFNSERHDNLVRNALVRIRKQCEIKVRSLDQRLSLENGLVVSL